MNRSTQCRNKETFHLLDVEVRLAIAEKGLRCEEYDVSLPLSEHNEPWFMHLNPTGEVPVLMHEERSSVTPCTSWTTWTHLTEEGTPRLIPEEGSAYFIRVQHYRELLDSLQMDAYTHGCLLHPEITVDSHIPAYAATCIRKRVLKLYMVELERVLKLYMVENRRVLKLYMVENRKSPEALHGGEQKES
ncbi:hypothetical protein F7725_028493 [Dissostichus mawsoni]|uniref:GST N-terminal domain-containing protein n=1 Tax=Dissostichus mawsoni TaxID=36200 RepID=A0A7J5XFU4_DISMA|nr:hypothetical protein F7725_028493 [Dissostichus mawsoni]